MATMDLHFEYHKTSLYARYFKNTDKVYYMWYDNALRAMKVSHQILVKDRYQTPRINIYVKVAGVEKEVFFNYSSCLPKVYTSVSAYKANTPLAENDYIACLDWVEFFKAFPQELGTTHVYETDRYGCVYPDHHIAYEHYTIDPETGCVKRCILKVHEGSILVQSTEEGAKPLFTGNFLMAVQDSFSVGCYPTREACEENKLNDIEIVKFDDEDNEEPQARLIQVTLRMI